MQTSNDNNGVPFPSSSTVPLLQSEEFENGDSLGQSRTGVDSEETDIGDSSAQNSMENGSSPLVLFQRVQSHLSGASSSSSSGRSQSNIDSKTTTIIGDHGAPPTTVPLLQFEEPNGASSGSHSTILDVLAQPSSAGSNLTLNDQNNASTGTGYSPVLGMHSHLSGSSSSSSSGRSQSSIDSRTTNIIGDHGAPSPTTVPLLQYEESKGVSSTGSGSHSTILDVPAQPSSTGSNLTLNDQNNASTGGSGSSPVLGMQSAHAHLAIDVQSDHNADDEKC